MTCSAPAMAAQQLRAGYQSPTLLSAPHTCCLINLYTSSRGCPHGEAKTHPGQEGVLDLLFAAGTALTHVHGGTRPRALCSELSGARSTTHCRHQAGCVHLCCRKAKGSLAPDFADT